MSVPIFSINLDSRPDRWRMQSRNLEQIGLSATRIEAMDKAELTDDPQTRWMGHGHVACLRSHGRALEAFLNTGALAAVILEDDAELHPDLSKVISCLDWWPKQHGLVHLECFAERPWLGCPLGFTQSGQEVRPILEKYLGSAGYLIDRVTAVELVSLLPTSRMPMDILLFNPNWSGFARRTLPLQLVPALVRQRPNQVVGSDIGEFSGISDYVRFKPSRAFRYPHKFRMRVLLAMTGQARRMSVPFGTGV